MIELGKFVEEIPEGCPHLLVCDEEEWSALYVDGALDRVGDTDNVEERIRELAGVITLQTDDFLQGGNGRSDVAQTLDALRAYRAARRSRRREADRMRAQAMEMLRVAEELDGKKLLAIDRSAAHL